MRPDEADDRHPLSVAFEAFIKEDSFPCVGAKSALARDQLEIVIARDIRSSWDDLAIIPKLHHFARRYREDPSLFTTFAVIFEEPDFLSEAEFEQHLWTRLQSFSDKDSMFGQSPDQKVASDPADHNFSISFGGEAFFVVGLHPGASRPARQFRSPVLVFNLHDQFVKLREQGRYEKMHDMINDRDIALSGTANPMLVQHGLGSAARQYSGRAVGDDWECPFEHKDFSWPKLSKEESRPMVNEIAPRSGVAFKLNKGQRLRVIDPKGEQVADLLAYRRGDVREVISSGRTLDYVSRLYLTAGDPLYSNRSNILLQIVEDTVGRHDFLLTPCSAETFKIIYGETNPHRGCFGNLAEALAPYGIGPDDIPVAFNIFMNVPIDPATGALRVEAPKSKPGDYVLFEAQEDLIIGLTACSAPQSNNFAFKPIHYEVF